MKNVHCSAFPTAVISIWLVTSSFLDAACCYFAARSKDIEQPAQKAFITWNPDGKQETFTVQPKFEGNARDFGMVIPTPSRPKLDEMPREFFKALAVFTILEPMDEKKFKTIPLPAAALESLAESAKPRRRTEVKVLEAGVVGNLDYKIITAERADDLFEWLKENGYTYSGDEETLRFYIDKKWVFTVMKIDPAQLRQGKLDDRYAGEITPTRFTFTYSGDKPVYPLRITRISVKDQTEALFYIQAPWKTDFTAAPASYQHGWEPMWHSAIDMAEPKYISAQEKAWREISKPRLQNAIDYLFALKKDGFSPATLEWAKKITPKDISWLNGAAKFNREAPAEEVAKLRLLQGHVREGQFVTKIRKIFKPAEMNDDLLLTRAGFNNHVDDLEYFSVLPTSPP
jgi:Uncharacterized protein conserved in bacteria (DUF2330)